MLLCIAAALLSFASAATVYVADPGLNSPMSWHAAVSWVDANGQKVAPPTVGDDVVFVRSQTCKGHDWLVLSQPVSVRSITLRADWTDLASPCPVSLVIEAELSVGTFTATDAAQVFLNGGNITAPVLLFDSKAMLGGSGVIAGEVVLRGNATILSG